MPDQFTTIKDNSQGYYTEKRSKFLAFAHHVETTEEIKQLIAAYRKKYHDARHVCHAYTLGPDRACYHASDDGEPSSTAGKPILGQINTNNLTDIVIIVVRYYGGINLGTSRLIAAYRAAAADALAHACTETRYAEQHVTFRYPYQHTTQVMRIVNEMAPRIVSHTFDETCTITLAIRQSQAEQLKKRLEEIRD